MKNIKVKICCISSLDEAFLAINLGAHVLGLVGKMPSGPGIISDDLIAEIAAAIPKPIESFLLTSETEVEAIIKQHAKVNTTAIQIVDKLTKGTHKELKAALPHIKIVQVLHILNQNSVDKARAISGQVDALLLDSGNPNLEIKELGGTGRIHNWELSKSIVEQVKIPVFLAGGINASNALKAIKHVKPYGLDLCSSVRTNGLLDVDKLAAFFSVINHK